MRPALLGTSIVSILLILGLSAWIMPLKVQLLKPETGFARDGGLGPGATVDGRTDCSVATKAPGWWAHPCFTPIAMVRLVGGHHHA